MDLIKASQKVKTRVATKHILLMNYKGVDVSIYPSGRMIIKAKTREESLDITRNLLADLGFSENERPKT